MDKKAKKEEKQKVMKTKDELREIVKTMPMNKVFELAVITMMQKQYQARSMSNYFKTPLGREKHNKQQLKQYYIKKDQYHPELNPDGKIEKKYKRQSKSQVSEGTDESSTKEESGEHQEK